MRSSCLPVIAAAEVTVDDFSAELDMPIPGFDVVKPWMPKLNIGGDSTEETTALQVSYCKALVDSMSYAVHVPSYHDKHFIIIAGHH